MRAANGLQGVALPRPGAALDELQSPGSNRMIESPLLIRPQAARRHGRVKRCPRNSR
jgi:hypothetical protein